MGEPYHLIEDKAEQALLKWIQAHILAGSLDDASTATGMESSDIDYPVLAVVAVEVLPEEDGSGNYTVTLSVQVQSKLTETTKAAHKALVGSVCDVLVGHKWWSDAATEINGVASPVTDFTAISWQPGARTQVVEAGDDIRITEQIGELYCAPSSL